MYVFQKTIIWIPKDLLKLQKEITETADDFIIVWIYIYLTYVCLKTFITTDLLCTGAG